jgi:hypothetical protein
MPSLTQWAVLNGQQVVNSMAAVLTIEFLTGQALMHSKILLHALQHFGVGKFPLQKKWSGQQSTPKNWSGQLFTPKI